MNENHDAVFIDEIKLTSLKKNLLEHKIQVNTVCFQMLVTFFRRNVCLRTCLPLFY